MKSLLRAYIQLRIDYYKTRDAEELATINGETAQLQDQLWRNTRDVAIS